MHFQYHVIKSMWPLWCNSMKGYKLAKCSLSLYFRKLKVDHHYVLTYYFWFVFTVPPVQGVWSAWTEWSKCSAECNGGIQMRSRSCDYPVSALDTVPCSGNTQEWKPCNTQICQGWWRSVIFTPLEMNFNGSVIGDRHIVGLCQNVCCKNHFHSLDGFQWNTVGLVEL